MSQAGRGQILRILVRRRRLARVLPLVVLLKAWHYAQVRLAFGTVVLGLSPQDASVRVDRVPAEVAAERRPRPNHWAVLRPPLQGYLAHQALNVGGIRFRFTVEREWRDSYLRRGDGPLQLLRLHSQRRHVVDGQRQRLRGGREIAGAQVVRLFNGYLARVVGLVRLEGRGDEVLHGGGVARRRADRRPRREVGRYRRGEGGAGRGGRRRALVVRGLRRARIRELAVERQMRVRLVVLRVLDVAARLAGQQRLRVLLRQDRILHRHGQQMHRRQDGRRDPARRRLGHVALDFRMMRRNRQVMMMWVRCDLVFLLLGRCVVGGERIRLLLDPRLTHQEAAALRTRCRKTPVCGTRKRKCSFC